MSAMLLRYCSWLSRRSAAGEPAVVVSADSGVTSTATVRTSGTVQLTSSTAVALASNRTLAARILDRATVVFVTVWSPRSEADSLADSVGGPRASHHESRM